MIRFLYLFTVALLTLLAVPLPVQAEKFLGVPLAPGAEVTLRKGDRVSLFLALSPSGAILSRFTGKEASS